MKRILLILILILSVISAFAVTKLVFHKKEPILSEKEASDPRQTVLIAAKHVEAQKESEPEPELIEKAAVEPAPAVAEEPAVTEKAEAGPGPEIAEEVAVEPAPIGVTESSTITKAESEPEPELIEKAAVEPAPAVAEEPAVTEKAEAGPGPEIAEEAVGDQVAIGATESSTIEKAEAESSPKVIEEAVSEPSELNAVGRERIAVLPFDNFTKETGVLTMIMPELKQRLEDRGLYVIDNEVLTDFLCDRRIRPAGFLSKKITQEVSTKLKARTILAGSIVSFGTDGIPRLGIMARLIDSSTGKILWADYASVSGDDYSIVFGLGKIKQMESLVPKALDKLFASFSTDVSKKAAESVYRIAVMPFKNESDYPDAGMIATYMFLIELFKDPRFEPVEYGEIRRLCVEFRIRNKGGLEYKNIKAISEALGTYGILLGSVDTYFFGSRASSMPKVGITARLLAARENRILWYNSLQLTGEEDTVAFDWGRVRHVDRLSYKVVTELLNNMGKAKRFQ